MNILSNINNHATPYSLNLTDAEYLTSERGLVYGAKNKYVSQIIIQQIRNLYSKNIKDKVTLFGIKGSVDCFGNYSGITSYIGEININASHTYIQYSIYLIDQWTSQDSNYTEKATFPSDAGCVFCPRQYDMYGGSFNLIGVYDSFLYYNIIINNNESLICKRKIDNPSTEWEIRSDYNGWAQNNDAYAVDETGVYICYYYDNIVVKYDAVTANKSWEYNISNPYIHIIQNKGVVIYNDSIVNILDTSGNLIKSYDISNITNPSVFVDYVMGYILICPSTIDKNQLNTNDRIIIIDSNGDVLLNLQITTSSILWSRIAGTYITAMAINKNKELWIISNMNQNAYLTKVSVTSNNIGTRQFQISVSNDLFPLSKFFQDGRTGGMYIKTGTENHITKYENLQNIGKQLFVVPYRYDALFFDNANMGMIYTQNEDRIEAIRDNSYGIDYYKDLFMS